MIGVELDATVPLVFTGGRVFGESSQVVEDGVLVVANGIIEAVGQRSETRIPPGAKVYDVSGMVVMPGLIDGHVHLLSHAGDGHSDVHLWNVTTFVEEQTLHAARNAEIALMAGVTTVRDMAGSRPEIAVKHAVRDGVVRGARVISCGFVGMTAGHGDMFCPPFIERRLWKTADGVDACRQLVREYVRDGSDWIKICTSGGVLSQGDAPAWRNYTDEEVCAVVDEAHALGKRVASHAHTEHGIRQAVEAKVDTVEHGTEMTEELADQMAAAGIALCPTLALSEYLLREGEARGVPQDSLAKAAAMSDKRITAIRRAHAAGVRIFLGTDSCNAMPFGRHAWELELVQQALGISPLETLMMATEAGATALGIGTRTGSLAKGKAADVLLVRGDPLSDLTILRKEGSIAAVLLEGRPLVGASELERLRRQRRVEMASPE